MKKRILVLLLFVCLFLTGCSNGFAKREYISNGKIAKVVGYDCRDLDVKLLFEEL